MANDHLYTQKILSASSVFDHTFVDAKALYLERFNAVASMAGVHPIDCEKALPAFRAAFGSEIREEVNYQWYDFKKKGYSPGTFTFVMHNDCIVEISQRSCQILHPKGVDEFVERVTALMIANKERERREPFEINLIVKGMDGLELKALEIKRTKLDLTLFYEDGFSEIDAVIRKRLRSKNDKGIILLHGPPGTGKTTYLRYLIGRIKKRVLFLSPEVAGNLMSPELIDLLIDNPNSVIVIEDAENIITDRRLGMSSSAVSGLLNISDGLLADCLAVQLVCTFNSSLTTVDPALMRKGRLIARYEFGKLSVSRAQKLSEHFGFRTDITAPMTLAEIAGQDEPDMAQPKTEVAGFRRLPV